MTDTESLTVMPTPSDAQQAKPASAQIFAIARQAQCDWATLSIEDRSASLAPLAKLIAAHVDEIADLIAAENGKPRVEAIAHEVVAAVALARHHCRVAPKVLRPTR